MNISVPTSVTTKARSAATSVARTFTTKPSKKALVIGGCVAGGVITAGGIYFANPQLIARGAQVTKTFVTSAATKKATTEIAKRTALRYSVGVGAYGGVNVGFDWAFADKDFTFKDGMKSFTRGIRQGATSKVNILLSVSDGVRPVAPRTAQVASITAFVFLIDKIINGTKGALVEIANDVSQMEVDFNKASNKAWGKYVGDAIDVMPEAFTPGLVKERKFTAMSQGDMNILAGLYTDRIGKNVMPSTLEKRVRDDFDFAKDTASAFIDAFATAVANSQAVRYQKKTA